MNQRILIIDDEVHIRQMMRLALEAAGYEVGEAQDGPAGLKVYDDGSDWDGVVLDQRMPGMDGLETLRRLKEVAPDVRVIMATAYASIELAVDAMKLGATDFIRKPMTPETLRNAVGAALAKRIERPAAAKDVDASKPESAPPGIVKTITLNGFSIVDEGGDEQVPNQRRFLVVSSDGNRQEVLVQIDEEPVGYVERMTRRRLPPESSFWTEQARDLLSDYLWSEGKMPPTGKLTLRDFDPDKLPIAERWSGER